MDKLNYENEYGRLSLEIVGDLESIGSIQFTKISDHHKISIDNGEKVALLTGVDMCKWVLMTNGGYILYCIRIALMVTYARF
jgi:hypothetical protein